MELGDYTLEKAYEENFFPSDEAFSQKDGFYIAAALTRYDGSSEVIEDPSIGTLKMYIKSWDVYDAENGGLKFTEIPLRAC